ncbi:MAG TPA: hypothetical protein OQH54_05040 [Nitrosopumilus sp.]|nr:hypothetical protein [Thermoproteota archaeon]HJJ23064.1 hypothetical protein [Nitrosopumilus sp.]
MDDELPETVKKCFDILEENVEILTNLEFDLESEQDDELTPNMELHQLYNMTEDVAVSAKIKHAEYNLARRQSNGSF